MDIGVLFSPSRNPLSRQWPRGFTNSWPARLSHLPKPPHPRWRWTTLQRQPRPGADDAHAITTQLRRYQPVHLYTDTPPTFKAPNYWAMDTSGKFTYVFETDEY